MTPQLYKWLDDIKAPRMVVIGRGYLGTKEVKGAQSNPVILAMAKTAEVDDIYKDDDIAWCAVAHAAIAIEAGKEVPFKKYDRLRAVKFQGFGNPVVRGEEMRGDTLIFKRPGGYHVGIYIGEDIECFHVMGGNQGNSYSIDRIKKVRLLACRRPHYNNQPPEVQKVWLEATGKISDNEA